MGSLSNLYFRRRVRRSGKPWTVVSDVDGVLTRGSFLYSSEGKVFKEFGSHDADAISLLGRSGVEIVFVSADKRGFEITRRRIEDMGFSPLLLDPAERTELIRTLQKTRRVVYLGDSFSDFPALRQSDIGVMPRGAFQPGPLWRIMRLSRRGGEGALAEMIFELFIATRRKGFLD